MSLFFKNSIVKKVSILFIVCGIICGTPLTTAFAPQQAQAGLLDGLFGGGVGNIVQDPQNILTNTIQTSLMTDLNLKEMSLDGIFYNIAQKALQQMVGNILTFINTGNDGQPMYVTNLPDRLHTIDDETAKNFIYGDQLSTACQPFEISVRVALAAQVQFSMPGGFAKEVACTVEKPGVDLKAFVSGNFNAGGWDTWFETVLKPTNTSLGLLQKAKLQLVDEQSAAKANQLTQWNWANGYDSQQVCTDVQTPSGTQKSCKIVTPGALIKTQADAAVTAPMQSLLNVNQINEVVGNLFSNLATQIFSGTDANGNPTGLTGLQNASFGPNGNQNYFGAVASDPTNVSTSTATAGSNPIENAYQIQARDAKAVISIVYSIESITACSPDTVIPVDVSNQFQSILDQYKPQVVPLTDTLTKLSQLSATYASSTSVGDQQSIMSTFGKMQTDGQIATLADAITNEQFLNTQLVPYINDFKKNTNYVPVSGCPATTTAATSTTAL